MRKKMIIDHLSLVIIKQWTIETLFKESFRCGNTFSYIQVRQKKVGGKKVQEHIVTDVVEDKK
jgi:hypothetical protein